MDTRFHGFCFLGGTHVYRVVEYWRCWLNMVNWLDRRRFWNDVQDLEANYENDYYEQLTGIASRDINYYDYNRGNFLNRDYLSVIPLTLSEIFQLTFKPYYSRRTPRFWGASCPWAAVSRNGFGISSATA